MPRGRRDHARAEPDALGARRAERKRRVELAADRRRIRDAEQRETVILDGARPARDLARRRRRHEVDAELNGHACASPRGTYRPHPGLPTVSPSSIITCPRTIVVVAMPLKRQS